MSAISPSPYQNRSAAIILPIIPKLSKCLITGSPAKFVRRPVCLTTCWIMLWSRAVDFVLSLYWMLYSFMTYITSQSLGYISKLCIKFSSLVDYSLVLIFLHLWITCIIVACLSGVTFYGYITWALRPTTNLENPPRPHST